MKKHRAAEGPAAGEDSGVDAERGDRDRDR